MQVDSIDFDNLGIVLYPDPRLKRACAPVTQFDENLRKLAERMFIVMREQRGIGLAAPQVGVLVRMFVMNTTGDPDDDVAYVNPEILDGENPRESEEGCLSIPDIRVQIRRPTRCRLRARTLTGRPIELEGDDLVARCWQHETDHLNGMLIIDRMGPADRIATRQRLRELEAAYKPATEARR